jgi:hypothetical protein
MTLPNVIGTPDPRSQRHACQLGLGSSRVGSGAPGLRVSNSRAHEGSLSVMLNCRWGVCQAFVTDAAATACARRSKPGA